MPREFTYSVSMNQDAKYVTQSSIYDCPILGKLTNRRIAKYQQQGKYNVEINPPQQRAKKKKIKVNWLKDLLNNL